MCCSQLAHTQFSRTRATPSRDETIPPSVARSAGSARSPASLLPLDEASPTPPTAVLGGFNMHRTKGIDPAGDTDNKLRALGKKGGRVLDVCTGLGYTCLGAARTPFVDSVRAATRGEEGA